MTRRVLPNTADATVGVLAEEHETEFSTDRYFLKVRYNVNVLADYTQESGASVRLTLVDQDDVVLASTHDEVDGDVHRDHEGQRVVTGRVEGTIATRTEGEPETVTLQVGGHDVFTHRTLFADPSPASDKAPATLAELADTVAALEERVADLEADHDDG